MKTKAAIYIVFLIGLLFSLISSCSKKEAIKTAPTVTVSSVTNISATTGVVKRFVYDSSRHRRELSRTLVGCNILQGVSKVIKANHLKVT